jgi:hypothetical protein
MRVQFAANYFHDLRFEDPAEGFQHKSVDLTLHNGGHLVVGSRPIAHHWKWGRNGARRLSLRQDDAIVFQMPQGKEMGHPRTISADLSLGHAGGYTQRRFQDLTHEIAEGVFGADLDKDSNAEIIPKGLHILHPVDR